MIDQTMTRLRSLVERTGVAMFLVSHLRRTSSDQTTKRVPAFTWDSCADLRPLHNSLTELLHSNETSRAHLVEVSTTVRVLKNRYSGEVGVACQLSYDLNTCKFNETEPMLSSIQRQISEDGYPTYLDAENDPCN
jgi:twinkle protein